MAHARLDPAAPDGVYESPALEHVPSKVPDNPLLRDPDAVQALLERCRASMAARTPEMIEAAVAGVLEDLARLAATGPEEEC